MSISSHNPLLSLGHQLLVRGLRRHELGFHSAHPLLLSQWSEHVVRGKVVSVGPVVPVVGREGAGNLWKIMFMILLGT